MTAHLTEADLAHPMEAMTADRWELCSVLERAHRKGRNWGPTTVRQMGTRKVNRSALWWVSKSEMGMAVEKGGV